MSHHQRLAVTRIFGVPISLVNLQTASSAILSWCISKQGGFVCVREVHGLIRSVESPELLAVHERAKMVTPDGMPIAWILKARGHVETGRVCGSDLFEHVCNGSRQLNVRHFLCGGKPGVADALSKTMLARFPGISIAGTYCPPFRALTIDEENDLVDHIKASGADLIWVGISSPKQELWMDRFSLLMPGRVFVGVGAVFDFQTGAVKRAPRFAQELGLEWLFRLLAEPRRLFGRYAYTNLMFLYLIIRDAARGRPVWASRL